ncbi:MAG TPA: 4-hydroxythreonine-4-phosphate dehydrogenase PdxA [Flavobacteriaceae bacterium]|nr:4-hydroxythreonine-4-phosphate dehydrogenase PdxA [Flavobacteriaceae bacterium]
MTEPKKVVVGISVGDLNGVGAEVIIKTFEDSRMLDFCTPVIFGSVRFISFVKKLLSSELNFHGIDKLEDIIPNRVNVLNVWKEHVDISPGEENTVGGTYALKSLEASVYALKNNEIDVLVTAPIHKKNIQSEKFHFPGHTDYLAQELEGESLMFMLSEDLRVGLVTDHVPLKEVVQTLSARRIEKKIELMHQSLKEDFGIIKPKIAVLSVNPHAGDGGVIGTEDDTLLKPLIENLRNKDKLIFGPYAADGFFGSRNYKNFDAVLGCYHDQGLIPFKTLSFGRGVNFTAGLSKVRTSPDHGTAFDIAGKNIASCDSFREAVYSAIDIFKQREEYKILNANPLEISQKRSSSKKRF